MIGTTTRPFRASPLWAKCLFTSFALHAAALYLAVEHPLVLKKAFGSFFSKSSPSPTYIARDEKWDPNDTFLEHFFEEIETSSKRVVAYENKESIPLYPLEEKKEKVDFLTSLPKMIQKKTESSKFSLPQLVDLTEKNDLPLVQAEISPLLGSHTEYLSKPNESSFLAQEFKFSPIWIHDEIKQDALYSGINPSSQPIENLSASFPISDFLPIKESNPTTPISLNIKEPATPLTLSFTPLSLKAETPFEKLERGTLGEINEYLPDELLFAVEWNDLFNVTTTLFPKEDGYVFSLNLTPCKDLSLHKMQQNYYFLIDASSDVEKHKLTVFKKSVLKALAALSPNDNFNIVLFDQKSAKLSPYNLSCTPANIHRAEEFLEKHKEKVLFASTNLYKNLQEFLALAESEEEAHTAILLTNGKSSANSSAKGKDLKTFLEKNSGKMSVYAAAVGQNNDLVTLDMISSLNGGKLLYSDTNASFPRKLATFVKGLGSPLLKKVSLSVEASNPKATIKLASLPSQLPNIYNGESVTIMGKIDRLCDLHFVLQGQGVENQVFLKKVVSLEDATLANTGIKKEWNLHSTIEHYEKFLKDSKAIHLQNAKEVLKSVHGRTFE